MSLYRRCQCGAPEDVDCGHPWWYLFKYAGQRYRASTDQTTRAKAALVEIKRHAAVIDQATGIAKPRKAMRLKTHLEGYVEWAKNDHPATWQKDADTLLPRSAVQTTDQRKLGPRAKSFLDVVGNKPIDQVSSFDIERWRNVLVKTVIRGGRTMSRTTVNRKLNSVRGCFTKAVEWKRITASPVDAIAEWTTDDPHIRILTSEERVIVLTQLPAIYAMYCRVTLEALLRINEVVHLKPTDLGDRSIQRRLKGGKVQTIPVTAQLIADLRTWIKTPTQRFVWGDAAPKPRSIASQMTKAFRRVGLRGISHHVMRHTGVTDMLEDGVSPIAIKAYAGWTSLRMLERYGHLRDAELLRAVAGTAARNRMALVEGERRNSEQAAAAHPSVSEDAAAAQSVPVKNGATKKATRGGLT